MEETAATDALAALAHEHRLRVFRRLVCEGPGGMTAGALAAWLGMPASSLSFHLAQLERARLIRSWRVARHIYYALDVEGARRLIGYLTEDCCQGRPEICGYAPDERRKTDQPVKAAPQGLGQDPDPTADEAADLVRATR